jgi:hypothetical protein
MTRRLATTCLMTMLLLGFSAPPLPAQSDFENVILKGISSIFVLVEDLPSGASALGLTRDAIQTDVDLKLLLAGMPVVTPEDGTKLPGEPYLWVQVTVTGESQAANIAVAVRQDVRLEQRPWIRCCTLGDESYCRESDCSGYLGLQQSSSTGSAPRHASQTRRAALSPTA